MQEMIVDFPLYEADIGGKDFREFKSFKKLSIRDAVTEKDMKRLGELRKAGIDSGNHVVIFYENGVVEHNHSKNGARDCAVYFYG
jgi:hypothetical protein